MDREECYKILRDMGVSVETADAMAERLAKEPPRKQEAFLLWASGYNNCQVARMMGCSEITIRRLIKYVELGNGIRISNIGECK